MAQWTKVLIFIFALPCVNSSRIYQNHDSRSQEAGTSTEALNKKSQGGGISPEMVKALNDWYSAKPRKYRYVILNVPEDPEQAMEGHTAPKEKTYKDFLNALESCPGPCLGAFEFSWELPRGNGFVTSSEAAMFSWAPDDPPPKYQNLRMRRTYMSMKMDLTNFRVSAIKKVISRWNPKIMQAGDRGDLKPEWIVPQLRGGRFGNRVGNLNKDGTALYEQLKKEMEGDASAVDIPDEPDEEPDETDLPRTEEPDETDEPVHKPVKPPTPASKEPTGAGMTSEQLSQFKREMYEIIQHEVKKAFDEKKAEIMKSAEQAAQKAVETVATVKAKEAAKAEVVAIFKDLSKKI